MDFITLTILVCMGLAGANSAPFSTKSQITRIIGGSKASIEKFPYQVSLYHYQGLFVCGGSIIAKNYVLTAAHCVESLENGYVRAGSVRLYRGGIISNITEIKRHNFTSDTKDVLLNDIAILKVEPEFVFDDTLQSIELYDGNLDDAAANGNTTVVSGFGNTEELGVGSHVLMAVEVPIVDKKLCSKYYIEARLGPIGNDRFCAGAMEGGHSTCYGDSGGPLVMGGRQIGVVSYGLHCGRPNYVGVNTNVAFYLDWIRENIKESGNS